MSENDPIFNKLSGETKALILIQEYRLRKLGLPELASILNALVSSDLERIGILELIRREGPESGLSNDDTSKLVNALTDMEPDTARETTFHAGTGRTIRLRKFDAPGATPPTPQGTVPTPTFKVRRVDTMQLRKEQTASQQATPQPPQHAPHQTGPFYGGSTLSSLATDGLKKMGEQKILVADDDTRIRMIFRKKLEEGGYLVDEAPDGDKAWALLQEKVFGVVVLDMKMPGLHGLEILGRLAKGETKPPVIICSAYEQLQQEFVVSTYPKLRYLVKPVPMDKLLATVKELLNA